MKFFQNLFSLPRNYFFLLKKVQKQKRFLEKYIEKDLGKFRNNKDGSIEESDFRKIRAYYGLGVPAIVGESFAVLQGRALRREERFCLTYLGGISGLLDDLFDDPLKKVDHLEAFILNPEKLNPHNSAEDLLRLFYSAGLSFSPHPELLKNQALKVYQAQKESLVQKEMKTGFDTLKNLSFNKGGTSFVFYRLCLADKPSKAEEELIFHLGGVMQLGNDIFDVWKDLQEGIRTVATETKDIKVLKKLFLSEMEKLEVLTSKLSFPEKQKKKFIQLINLGLARVFVILDQFELLQKDSGNIFLPQKYERKQLICDMEKAGNQILAIRYFLAF